MGYFSKYNIPFQCITPLPLDWKGGIWIADIEKADDGFSWKPDNYFLDTCKNYNYSIEIQEPNIVFENPPEPLNTSKIQQVSPYSAKNTMSYLYQLYEMGYITYIRTDVKKYSNTFIQQVCGYIRNEYGNEYLNSEASTLLSISEEQGAHEAIRPTDIHMTPAKLTAKNAKKELNVLYSIIYKYTLESFSTPCQLFNIKCIIQNIEESDTNLLQFQYTTNQTHFYGWKIFTKCNTSTKSEDNNYYNYLTSLRYSSSQTILCHKLKIYPKPISKYNSYYTESKLIDKLEKLGIGRPSTYASLTDKLLERKYVTTKQGGGIEMILPYYELQYIKPNPIIEEKSDSFFFCEEKNKLMIEPLGIEVIEYLLEHFENLFDYTYTKDMEDKLDEIANTSDVDSGIIQRVCSEYYVNVTSNISNDKKDNKIRSLSDGDLGMNQSSRCLGLVNNNTCVYIKKGRYGTYVEWNNEIGEVCRVSVSNIVGNRPLENIILSEVEPFLNLSEKSDKSDKSEKKQGFVRLVTKNITIHYGKYGYYIQFKTPVMKKARLYNLNGFTNDVLTCNVTTLKKWIGEKYNIF